MVNAMYGLPQKHWRTIYRILERQEALQWVKLFGSRARGDYRCTSDVDLAFAGAAGVRERLLSAFERSGLPYTFDVIDYGRQANERLQQTVDIEGKLISIRNHARQLYNPTKEKSHANHLAFRRSGEEALAFVQ